MKKLFVIIVLMALVMSGFAQQLHYHFSEVVESGQTLYFLKRDYAPQEVWVTYPCFRDYYANGDHITTYYYGYEKPVGDLVIPSTITHNDTVYTVTRIDFSAFYECKDITSVVFPNTLTFIGQRSFLSCNGITGEVVIPNSVTIIGTNAFSFCHGITSVVFGHALREIRDLAFHQCYALEHISSLPDSLTKLGDDAFNRCPIRDSIIIPPGVATIGEHAFYGCRIPSVVISEGVTTIKGGAFAGCPLGALDIPSSTISISQSSFDRTHLQSITVNEGNPVYDSRDNCNALIETETNTLLFGCRNTIIPNDIAIIGHIAFYSINELNAISIPNSVERLETSAFAGCNSLTTITLPPNISYIGVGALNCCGLTSIVSKSSTPPTAYNSKWQYGYDNSFMGVNRDIPIYIPVGTIDAYQNAEGWNYFTNFIETEMNLEGEWYYEILNDDGSITYQHLEYAADTTIGTERPKIIVRSNTIYDRDEITTEVTHEYLYEDNGKVYWWNKDLQEFTTLYDLTAEAGDEWEIKVGTESVTMHVDMVEYQELNGLNIRKLRISDENDLFSGDILCSFGHMTNFFPERLMNRGKGYSVEGLRCYWVGDALLYHNGDQDCDAIYTELHNGINEDGPSTGSGTFTVYPNPTDGILFVQTLRATSLPDQTYRITNLMGQTMLTGNISAETQQIDIAKLPAGMYFINVGETTLKFVIR
jgi:hypothetical protein